MSKIYETSIGGKNLSVEIGKVAELANGACILRSGDTVVLVIATNSEKPRDGIDFFPLSVDYEEKLYAAGKIPGGFIKREGRPSERSILTSRLIDRPIRPLFPKGYRNDVQVVATVLSMDQNANPDTMAMIGSSIALSISSIPFNGPTGSVSVGLIDGEFIINPDLDQRAKSQMYLVVSGTKEAIMMVEAGSNEISEDTMLKAILFAHEEIKKIVGFIEEIVNDIGKPKDEVVLFVPQEEILSAVSEYGKQKMKDAILTKDKQERLENMDKVKQDILEHFVDIYPENMKDVSEIIYKLTKDGVRELILKDKIRPDNRMHEEIRPIWSEASVLPRTHGSAIFTRGQTQVMSITTLGALGDVQILDGLSEEEEKRYMHHYNFPAYSVGEARPSRGPGRREIGHGALAERALEPMLPSKEDFPYAIRVVSEVLSSNGSTSQASVCGSTLSLLDAGVPLKDMVAGIAMGLIKEGDDVAILSDIQGMEDFLGDMDFKVAGTSKGITALQMDIKLGGIELSVLKEALLQAKEGRDHILVLMEEAALDIVPSGALPLVEQFAIDPSKIMVIIGKAGATIKEIIEKFTVSIDWDRDNGMVKVSGGSKQNVLDACEHIKTISNNAPARKDSPKNIDFEKLYATDEVVLGKVERVVDFGAFILLAKGGEGLLHISKISKERVTNVSDVLSVGQEIEVKVLKVKKDRIELSMN